MLLKFYAVLGQGSYGTVYRVEAGETKCAGKHMNLCDLDSIVREVVFLQYANHHGASIRIQGIYYCSNKAVAILMEECVPIERGPGTILDEEIAEPIQALHDIGIMHRDISPRNIMRRFDGSLALVDYGMCSFFGKMSCRRKLSTCVTTVTTRAPEVDSGRYTETIDVWSAGVVCLWYRGLRYENTEDADRHREMTRRHAEDYPAVQSMLLNRKWPNNTTRVSREYSQCSMGSLSFVSLVLEPLVACAHVHHDFGSLIFQSYKFVLPHISHHEKCIASQANALAKQVCGGDCRIVGAAAFAIVALTHERVSDLVDELASYAGISKQTFREYVGHVLASQRSWEWVSPCTHTKDANSCS
jgi:hypothetical protein